MVRLIANLLISFIILYFVLLKFGDDNFTNYIFFVIPIFIAISIYFIDKKITGNSRKSIYYVSVVSYFIISFLIFVYAISQITINFM